MSLKISSFVCITIVGLLIGPEIARAHDDSGIIVVPVVVKRTGNATVSDVLAGKTFSNENATGLNGTMPDNGAVAVTPGIAAQAIAEGYHNGFGTVAGDADLDSGNIKSGVSIFDITGTFGGVSCTGTLNGTRWCDNGDGTVTDMTTGLVWLQKANWGGTKPWTDSFGYDDANTRAGILSDSTPDSGLSDGSEEGDWRLPTLTELENLANGIEAVSSYTPRAFSSVQANVYWSSTTTFGATSNAWQVNLISGGEGPSSKTLSNWVWPVRNTQ